MQNLDDTITSTDRKNNHERTGATTTTHPAKNPALTIPATTPGTTVVKRSTARHLQATAESILAHLHTTRPITAATATTSRQNSPT